MKTRRFIQCDVFSPVPFQGNGLAVVVDAQGLSDEQMQRFAAWTNLAETTFLLPPEDASADYRVRIFTPTREMLFAGHPTLGSCATWLHCGGKPKTPHLVRQECGVGIVEIDASNTSALAFAAPVTTVKQMKPELRAQILQALGIAEDAVINAVELCNGPVWQCFELRSAADVLTADSSKVKWPTFKSIGLLGRHEPGSACDYEVRMLAPSSGMSEDPITGSLNAAIAVWMRGLGRLGAGYTVAQGTTINRMGRVLVRSDSHDVVWVGGDVHILIDGHVQI